MKHQLLELGTIADVAVVWERISEVNESSVVELNTTTILAVHWGIISEINRGSITQVHTRISSSSSLRNVFRS